MIENIYYLVIGLFLYNRYLFLEKSIMISSFTVKKSQTGLSPSKSRVLTCFFLYFNFVLFLEFATLKNFFKYFCVSISLDG